MASDTLRLRVVLDVAAKALQPLRQIAAGSSGAARAIKAARDRLKDLNTQAAAVDGVQKQAAEFARLNNQLKIKTALLQGMRAEGTATAAQLKREESAVRKLTEALDRQREAAGRARIDLQKLGVAGNLGAAQQRLKADIASTTAEMDRQRASMQRLAAAQRQAHHQAARGGALAATGAGMMYGGARAGRAALGVMGQARSAATEEVRIQALGLGTSESAKAVDFAKKFESYGTSRLDNLELMRDAITVFNDRHHAEEAMPVLANMKFANEAVFGEEHGADNARKFMDMMKVIEMRGGANNKEDFERNANYVQQVITATGGRVGADDWLQVIQRGKLAAKGFDEKEFFYRLEPLVQEMKGNAVGTGLTAAYQNLYQGRTTKRAAQNLEKFGLIGDYSKVKHDKVGQTSQLNPGALKGADIFRRSQFEWMETILIPALRAKGIESEQATIDAIGSIFSNTNASALMATMYQQRAMVKKGYELNSKAANINQLHALAKESPAGKEVNLRKRRDDLQAELSGAALPAYVALLELLTKATRAVTDFAQAHPQLTKAFVYGAAGAAMLVAGIGALLLPIGILMLKGAALRMIFARLGMQFSLSGAAMAVLRGAGGALAAVFGKVGAGAAWLMAGLRALPGIVASAAVTAMGALRAGASMALAGLRALAVFLVANPIVGALALLAGAAWMVYRNWEDMKGGFVLLCADLAAAVGGWWDSVRGGAAALWQDLVGLKDRFATMGGDLMDGLKNGIVSRLPNVREAIGGVADSVGSWFKEKLGIASPSRVMMQYGAWVSEGAAIGIEGGSPAIRKAAAGMVAAASIGLPAMAAGGPVPSIVQPSALTIDSRPPLSAPAPARSPIAGGGNTYHITVNVAPGADGRAIAAAIGAELDRRDRAASARGRSSLYDLGD